jgi:effector-binding domain-containing protein
MNVVELMVFIVFIILFFLLIFSNLVSRIKLNKASTMLQQSFIDYDLIYRKLEEALKKSDNDKIEQTEGFLKFVSQSRDWAFQYIETVQIAIKNFQDIFHPIADQYYKDKKIYGLPTAINQEEFGKLFEAYKKLIDELPDEGKKK